MIYGSFGILAIVFIIYLVNLKKTPVALQIVKRGLHLIKVCCTGAVSHFTLCMN